MELSAREGPEVVAQARRREQGGSPGRAPRRTLQVWFGRRNAPSPAASVVVELALCNSRPLLLLSPVFHRSKPITAAAHHPRL